MKIFKNSMTSTTFILIVSSYFAFMLNIKFWQFAVEKVEIDSFQVAFFVFTLPFFIFIPLVWFFSLITLPRAGKPLIMLMLVLSAASDYALQNLGIVINSDMIQNIAETNMREATDLITFHAVAYIFVVGILPAIWVCRVNVKYNSFAKELKQRLCLFVSGLLIIGLFAATSYKEYASFGRNNQKVRYYINTFNYVYAVARYYKRNADAKRKFVILDENPKIEPAKTAKPRVTVLIVGETARAGNFSLYGYEKNTNPLLSKRSDITVFKDVSSCGTATAISLPCMFSSLTKKKFSVSDALYQQNLLDIIKASGYDVLWLDNDDGCKKVCKRVENYDAKIGNKQPHCFGNYCHDDILLDELQQRISKITKDTLIVLHTMGSHGPTYYRRYPQKFGKFQPTCDTSNLQDCTREQIISTYDNTIVYTDYIINSTIEILKKHTDFTAAMLYVSDHGESLGENNIYLHGLPYAIAPEFQKKVPMILWLGEDTKKALNLDQDCLKKEAATKNFSHDNYFHSVLRLLFVKTTAYDKNLDIFSKCSQ